jgi:predicted dehydrogenase
MSKSICRWGILGAANIARKNWKAIRYAGNATLIAVASRDANRARQFVDDCQREVPYEDVPQSCMYDELLKRPDIDAVYIPIPTGVRKEWVVRTAEAGKHVLCEKPCASTLADLQVMLDACRSARVQFMDGVMFMHSERLPRMREILDDGRSVGAIRRISSQFSFAAPEEFLRSNIRVSGQLEPLGALGDLGWYNIRLSLWAMRYQLPEAVTGRFLQVIENHHHPLPLEFSGELLYPEGVTASFYCSFRTELQQWATLSGEHGTLRIDDFVLPYYGCESAFLIEKPVFQVEGTRFHMERHEERLAVREYSDGHPTAQETRMFQTFSERVLKGQIDPFWPEVAYKTQQVLEACLHSAQNHGQPVTLTPAATM